MTHRQRILDKLALAWSHTPNARLGQLLESVENVGWDMLPQHVSTPRLLWMANDLFEAALDRWNAVAEARVVVG